jgi:hypothetical protein
MATTKGAARSRAASAISETNGKGKTVKFEGITLVLPPEAPGDLAFSMENNEVSAAVRETFGEVQYVEIREKCKEKKFNLKQTYEAMYDLLRRSLDEWDLMEGE